jgi:hypothetical protein
VFPDLNHLLRPAAVPVIAIPLAFMRAAAFGSPAEDATPAVGDAALILTARRAYVRRVGDSLGGLLEK